LNELRANSDLMSKFMAAETKHFVLPHYEYMSLFCYILWTVQLHVPSWTKSDRTRRSATFQLRR
jgi:hypothetical protein